MKLSMKLSTLGLQKLNVAAGALLIWVAVGPWFWGYAGSASAVASHVFFLFAFGPLTLLILVLRPAAFVLLVAGLWLAISPWVLGYATSHTAWLSELVTGVLFSVVAGRAAAVRLSPVHREWLKHRGSPTSSRPAEAGSPSWSRVRRQRQPPDGHAVPTRDAPVTET
jgi:polyferredoxin